MAVGEDDAQPTEPTRFLPRSLQRRFESLGAYVQVIVNEVEATRPAEARLSDADLAKLRLMVFAVELERLMEEATTAGKRTVSVLEPLGVKGFAVGSSDFRAGSPDLLRGQKLAWRLREAMGEALPSRSLLESKSLAEVVRYLYGEVRRGH